MAFVRPYPPPAVESMASRDGYELNARAKLAIMRRGRKICIVGAIAVAACSGASTSAVAAATVPVPLNDFCSRVSPGAVAGAIGAPDLVELSGLAASHAFPGLLWANNDSGDAPRLFAMSDVGAPLGVFTIAGADAIDWEDIASGPGPDPERSYIYVGDIGDNAAARDHVTVYRVAEPDAAPDGTDGELGGTEAIQLTYPGGPEDAEALLVDPLTGDLFIITKQRSGFSKVLTAAAADLVATATVPMREVGVLAVPVTPHYDANAAMALPSTMVTGADISPDGGVVLVRTYQQVLAFVRVDGQTVAEALAGAPCEAPQVGEPQGEAIAFSATGDRYFLGGETQLAISQGALAATDPNPLAAFVIAPAAQPSSTTTVPATSAPATSAPATSAPATTVSRSASTTSPATTTPPSITVRGTVSTAPLPPGTSPPANRWWIWSIVATAMVMLGVLAMVARRRRPQVRRE